MKRRDRECTQMTENVIRIDNKDLARNLVLNSCDTSDLPRDLQSIEIVKLNQECQVNIFKKTNYFENSFTCNRFIYKDCTTCEAEVQTEILNINEMKTRTLNKKFKNKSCGTLKKHYVDQAVGLSFRVDIDSSVQNVGFGGFASVTTDEQMLGLAGVSLNNFNLLLKRIRIPEKCKSTIENCLFMFLVKIKTALSFSAIGVLFGVHRTTVSKMFFSILEQLAANTDDLVYFPSKDDVLGTMPQCFYPDYCNTRVIIDCTEFGIEVPSTVDNRVYCYSHYKKKFTAKVLIGITPSEFISFKSPVAGGRKSDSQITIESGLIDLLEDGDCVLADKGFPSISSVIEKQGKKVLVVMPPFLEKKSEFTTEQTEQTYNIAKVRIHVEQIMQRLRVYKILDKIPEHLFKYLDDIVHICCMLVNLQPPIFREKEQDLRN